MTTITSTANALARKDGGVSVASVSKHVSAHVMPDVLRSKATNTLADQSAPIATVSTTNLLTHVTQYGNGSKTVFYLGKPRAHPASAMSVYVAGVLTAVTWDAADPTKFTFASAPANNAAIVVKENITLASVTDATQGGPIVSAGSITRINR